MSTVLGEHQGKRVRLETDCVTVGPTHLLPLFPQDSGMLPGSCREEGREHTDAPTVPGPHWPWPGQLLKQTSWGPAPPLPVPLQEPRTTEQEGRRENRQTHSEKEAQGRRERNKEMLNNEEIAVYDY